MNVSNCCSGMLEVHPSNGEFNYCKYKESNKPQKCKELSRSDAKADGEL